MQPNLGLYYNIPDVYNIPDESKEYFNVVIIIITTEDTLSGNYNYFRTFIIYCIMYTVNREIFVVKIFS